MKKKILSLSMIASSLSMMAKNYPYLTIEMTDGKKTSFITECATYLT